MELHTRFLWACRGCNTNSVKCLLTGARFHGVLVRERRCAVGRMAVELMLCG